MRTDGKTGVSEEVNSRFYAILRKASRTLLSVNWRKLEISFRMSWQR